MGRRPFIIDCDTGTDDAIALVAAFGCEEIEVRAITSVNGNVPEPDTSRNNRNLAAYLGLNVEVAHGAAQPIGPRRYGYSLTHGHTGLGDVVLPDAEDYAFSGDMAPEVIRRIAVEENGNLELLVVGPMTNIAIALCLYPELKERIRHIWFMGGAIRGGNVTANAEFNIWVDPNAAQLVLSSGIPMTMVGLDVTEKAVLNREDEQEIRSFGHHGAVLSADLLNFMFVRRKNGGENALMHDALALAAAVCPECMEYRDYFVDVVCDSIYAAGHTMVDVRNRYGKEPNVRVAVELKQEVFWAWLKKSIKNCKSI